MPTDPFKPWVRADEDEKPARQPVVTRARARSAAMRELVESHDQEPDLSDAAYQLLVVECAPLLLAFASTDPMTRGQAQGRLRALAHRYRDLVTTNTRAPGNAARRNHADRK